MRYPSHKAVSLGLLLLMIVTRRFGFNDAANLDRDRTNNHPHLINIANLTISKSFVFSNINFRCNSVVCNKAPLMDSYFHIVAGIEHLNSFPMLIHRICEAFQQCFKPKNMFISLNYNSAVFNKAPPKNYRNAFIFLNSLGVTVDKWTGNFTANSKMMRYLESFADVNDPNKYIYHTGSRGLL